VRFAGWVPIEERDRLLDQAQVFAMLSRLPPGDIGGEGFGIVYLEAAARGLPVVAGAVGGALDAVADGETGLLVDPTSAEAVADALVTLLSNPGHARTLGIAGAARAREFSWERQAREVRTVIEGLCRDRSYESAPS
jgi:phosphatidylinositol alpha-1,6-mannosyltransferase